MPAFDNGVSISAIGRFMDAVTTAKKTAGNRSAEVGIVVDEQEIDGFRSIIVSVQRKTDLIGQAFMRKLRAARI